MERFLYTDDEGQGLVEYALIISLISIAIILSITLFGEEIIELFGYIWQEARSVFGG